MASSRSATIIWPPGTFKDILSFKYVGNPPPYSAVGMAQKDELTVDNHDVIATLNDLLEISRDGEQGFRTCAEGVESPNLKAQFESAARRCAEGEAELEAKIRSLGGVPAQRGSISGSMHRAWTNIIAIPPAWTNVWIARLQKGTIRRADVMPKGASSIAITRLPGSISPPTGCA
jgi:hypothetical protein